MKKLTLSLAITIFALVGSMFGQSYGAVSVGPIAPAVANCPAGVSGQATYCPVGTSTAGYATYVSYNGGAYQLLVPASTTITATAPLSLTGSTISCPTCITGSGTVGQVAEFTASTVLGSEILSYGQLSGLPTTTGACTGGTLTGTGTITANSSGTISITVTSATLTGCPF